VRVLVLGAGRMGGHHARMLGRQDDVREVWICDRHLDRAQALAREVGGLAVPREQAVPGSIDVAWVVVATPTDQHGEARGWAEAGADVLVEKPLAADLVAAERLRHPRIRVGHVERHNPVWGHAPLRGPLTVHVRRVVSRPPSTDPGRDVVSDLMLHDLDLLLHLRGGPLRVERVAGRADLHVVAELRGPGVVATVEAGVEGAAPVARCWEGVDADGPFRLDFDGRRAWRGGALVGEGGPDALEAQWRTLIGGGGVDAEEASTVLGLAATILRRLPVPHETPEHTDAT